MHRLPVLLAILFVGKINAGERMRVTLCNLAGLPPYLVSQAKTEAAFVFRSAGIEVLWQDCDPRADPPPKDGTPSFFIRLRKDSVPRFTSELSLHAMGRAFVSDGTGNLADVYYPAVQGLAQHTQASESSLVGYTIAHEIGHLLLGPGHRPHGIMRAWWDQQEALGISQRSLPFEEADRIRMRAKLRSQSNPGVAAGR